VIGDDKLADHWIVGQNRNEITSQSNVALNSIGSYFDRSVKRFRRVLPRSVTPGPAMSVDLYRHLS
jgi:hypothetical protein